MPAIGAVRTKVTAWLVQTLKMVHCSKQLSFLHFFRHAHGPHSIHRL